MREAHRELAGESASMFQEGDALILKTPSQVEVLRRYYLGHPAMYPIPGGNSLEREMIPQALQPIMRDHKRVIPVFGHRDEVDPQHLVRQWLNGYGHRAWDAW